MSMKFSWQQYANGLPPSSSVGFFSISQSSLGAGGVSVEVSLSSTNQGLLIQRIVQLFSSNCCLFVELKHQKP